jgi:hypothetical protein
MKTHQMLSALQEGQRKMSEAALYLHSNHPQLSPFIATTLLLLHEFSKVRISALPSSRLSATHCRSTTLFKHVHASLHEVAASLWQCLLEVTKYKFNNKHCLKFLEQKPNLLT